jgi:hypothetical protein
MKVKVSALKAKIGAPWLDRSSIFTGKVVNFGPGQH